MKTQDRLLQERVKIYRQIERYDRLLKATQKHINSGGSPAAVYGTIKSVRGSMRALMSGMLRDA